MVVRVQDVEPGDVMKMFELPSCGLLLLGPGTKRNGTTNHDLATIRKSLFHSVSGEDSMQPTETKQKITKDRKKKLLEWGEDLIEIYCLKYDGPPTFGRRRA